MFNALFKIPMQFFILLLGALLFVFYQFERPPLLFHEPALGAARAPELADRVGTLRSAFAAAHDEKRAHLIDWAAAQRTGESTVAHAALAAAQATHARSEAIRDEARQLLGTGTNGKARESDYVFITFILDHLPHGVIGLLVTVFFAATLSSKAGELNALGSTTTVDLYRRGLNRGKSDEHYVKASKWFTTFWGLIAILFALYANLVENLIQAVNIVASLFNGVVLGLFLVAFFFKRVGGTAVFYGAIAAQALVLAIYFLRHQVPAFDFSYLWHNVIGCAACMGFSLLLHAALGSRDHRDEPATA
jgi:Na+(H+)/acetate symporter ActP